jgi:hypothetical protein
MERIFRTKKTDARITASTAIFHHQQKAKLLFEQDTITNEDIKRFRYRRLERTT